MNPPKLINIRRLPPGELRVFIRDLIEGRIFTSAHISRRTDQEWADRLPFVFLPLLLGEWHTVPKDEQIGVCWAYYADQLGAGMNNYPMFLYCKWLHVDDWKIALDARDNAIEAIDRTAEGGTR